MTPFSHLQKIKTTTPLLWVASFPSSYLLSFERGEIVKRFLRNCSGEKYWFCRECFYVPTFRNFATKKSSLMIRDSSYCPLHHFICVCTPHVHFCPLAYRLLLVAAHAVSSQSFIWILQITLKTRHFRFLLAS